MKCLEVRIHPNLQINLFLQNGSSGHKFWLQYRFHFSKLKWANLNLLSGIHKIQYFSTSFSEIRHILNRLKVASKSTFQLPLQNCIFPDSALGWLPSLSDAIIWAVVHSCYKPGISHIFHSCFFFHNFSRFFFFSSISYFAKLSLLYWRCLFLESFKGCPMFLP